MENNNLFRPYNNALEFINDAKKHGPYVKCINNSIVGLKNFQWQDGTPCGIIKETNDGK